ncbi:unnamed protein product [Polarella glacialis]|uniref:SET domain-containing protein n=1 Tax=Polarella glacialis TaxID=89957 RepID=A0A813KVB8_POLGL|nr:unnamed protein product [Polarella glacialis]
MGLGKTLRLLRWAKACGSVIEDKWRQRSSTRGGRGVIATKLIKSGELVAAVHEKCMVSNGTIWETDPETWRAVASLEATPPLRPHAASYWMLTVFVLLHSGNPSHSRFSDYFGSMSTLEDLSSLPLFWSDGELMSELQGTQALGELQDISTMVRRDYDLLREVYPVVGQYSVTDYGLAYSFVAMHAFAGPKLIPILDLLNHDIPVPDERMLGHEAQNNHMDVKGEIEINSSPSYIIFRARRDYQPGDEIHWTYHFSGNHVYFKVYGFVLPWIHKLSCLSTTSLSLLMSDVPSKEDASTVEIGKRGWLGLLVGSCLDDKLTKALAFARFWSTPASLAELQGACGSLVEVTHGGGDSAVVETFHLHVSCKLVSFEAERGALAILRRGVVSRALAMQGPESLEAEEQLLQSLDPGTRKHKMVTIRRDEKYVLRRVSEYLSNFESRLNAAGSDWQEYVAYIGGLYNRTLD